MVRRGYAKRRDENEPEIVRALEACGLPVERLDPPAPDLLVGTADGRLVLLEVKDPTKKRGGRNYNEGGLTDSQVLWHARWAGYPVYVVRTPQEALEAVRSPSS